MCIQSDAPIIHDTLRRRLCSASLSLSCHAKEKEKVLQSLKRVVCSKESTCMLLVGTGAGAGMRLVLNSAINEVIYSSDNTHTTMDKSNKTSEVKKGDCPKPKAIVIHLNGVVHSGIIDEGRAMSEITAQICALIGPKLPRDSFSSSLSFVVETLKSHSISAIFVLEAFELFAMSPRQSFLYALVDLLAVPDISIGVFGLSPRLDTKDLLERRVVSRFGARQVVFTHLPPYPSPQSLPCMLLEMLILNEGEGGVSELSRLEWNKQCEVLLNEKDMVQVLNGWAGLGRELEWFTRLLVLALRREDDGVFLTQRALVEACDILEPDLQLQMLRNLSMPELIQVVAMTRLERRNQKSYGMDAVSSECQNFLTVASYNTPHRYKDPVMRSVFTHLLHSGVTEVVTTTGGRSVGRGAVQVRLQLNPEYVIEVIKTEKIACTVPLQRWCLYMG